MKKVLIIGATSTIAQEVSKCFAKESAWLFLVGRNQANITVIAEDLRIRGAGKVESLSLDLDNLGLHSELVPTAAKALGGLDIALIAYGTLPNQKVCEQNVETGLKEFMTNCIGVVSLLTHLANYFEKQESGCIAVITSVAGDRGRQSNYVYGAAKGATSIFLQGMRNRLSKVGVRVLTIKPGFVDTPMTAGLPKNFLFADPAAVGTRIFKAITNGEEILYVPWFWRWIMPIIRTIPESIFKRMKLQYFSRSPIYSCISKELNSCLDL
ncbi:MAG TPA: SDR family oxidoreductase [Nitrospiraceae bacterium]|nr:SDR family oxidoreductase [Nitrospiraceae bacterium]